MNHHKEIITVEPDKRSGQPCIRGMRITVYDIFEYLASGMTVAEVLDDFPELTEMDIRACFAYAADKEKSQMVVYYKGTAQCEQLLKQQARARISRHPSAQEYRAVSDRDTLKMLTMNFLPKQSSLITAQRVSQSLLAISSLYRRK
jgi:uncharacterized protein (DUF433 family)